MARRSKAPRKPAARKPRRASKKNNTQTVRVNVVQTVGAGASEPTPQPFQKGWSTYDIVRPMLQAHMPAANTGMPLSHRVGANTFGGDAEAGSVARSDMVPSLTPGVRWPPPAHEGVFDETASLFSSSPGTPEADVDTLGVMTVRDLHEMARREGIPIPNSVRKKNKAGLVEYLSNKLPRRD